MDMLHCLSNINFNVEIYAAAWLRVTEIYSWRDLFT